MEKFKQWIVSHKLISIIIASALVVCIALAIVLPLTIHKYDHACDTTCNICGKTREIEFEETEEIYREYNEGSISGHYTFITSKNVVSGKKSQHVFKVEHGMSEIFLDVLVEGATVDMNISAESVAESLPVIDYNIRVFDEEFNELNVLFESDYPEDPACPMAYVYIVDDAGNEIEEYDGQTVYYMLTLNKEVKDFRLRMQ